MRYVTSDRSLDAPPEVCGEAGFALADVGAGCVAADFAAGRSACVGGTVGAGAFDGMAGSGAMTLESVPSAG